MAWDSTQSSGTTINHTSWNNMVTAMKSHSNTWHSDNYYYQESDLTAVLNDNYAPSSGYHSHIINTSNPHSVAWSDVSAVAISDLNDNYPGSSNVYNKTWIDTFSGNLDTRIDAAGGGTLAGNLVGNISGDSYTYGIKDLDFISSQAISGGNVTTDSMTIGPLEIGHENGNQAYIRLPGVVDGSFNRINISPTLSSDTRPYLQLLSGGSTAGVDIDLDGTNLGHTIDIRDAANSTTIRIHPDIANPRISGASMIGASYLSSQVISGGHIKTGFTATAGDDVVNKTYFDANNLQGGSGQHYNYDYIIFKDGSNYEAQKGINGSTIETNVDFITTYNACVDDSPGGGIIQIMSGMYEIDSAHMVVSSNFWIRGIGDETVLKLNAKFIDIRGGQSNIRLSDFFITGYTGIYVRPYDNTGDVSNLHFENITASMCSGGGAKGAFAFNSSGAIIDDVTLVNCVVKNSDRNGFQIYGSNNGDRNWYRNFTFDRCKAINCGTDNSSGIYTCGFIFSDSTTMKGALNNFIITNCYASGNYANGFYFETDSVSSNIVIDNCISEYNGWGTSNSSYRNGFLLDGDTTISNCDSNNNRGNGILIGSDNFIVKGCHIHHCGGYGITAGGDENLVIDGNIINDVSGCAVYLTTTENSIVSNNIIRNCAYGGNNYALRGGTGCDNNIIEGNYIIGTASGGINFDGNSNVVGNYVSGTGSYYGIVGNGIKSNYICGFKQGISCRPNAIVVGNKLKSMSTVGIGITSDPRSIVTNNWINCTGTSTEYCCVRVYTNSDDVIVSNNYFSGHRGIYFVDTADNVNIIGNNFNDVSSTIGGVRSSTVKFKDNIGLISENDGWVNISDSNSFAHGCFNKPNTVQLTPSGSTPIMYSFTVDSSDITVYHSDANSHMFSWHAEV